MTEEDTPFKPTRTETIFKNAANVSLRGHTYDATHMDKFLGSGYGDKSVQHAGGNSHFESKGFPTHRTAGVGNTSRVGPGGGGGSQKNSFLSSNANEIRPSVSFVSMNRDEYKQTKYTDEQDGPSPMQILGNEKAFKDMN